MEQRRFRPTRVRRVVGVRELGLDVARDPNPHVAFGHGLHHCLGANLARREIAILLEELLPDLPGIEQTGPVEWGRSNKHTSLRHLPIRFGPR